MPVPVSGGSSGDGPRERTIKKDWRLDDRGVFSDGHGELYRWSRMGRLD